MERKRILIVDDEEGFARLLKLNLEQTGEYEVRVENQGVRALDEAQWFKPHLIFMDVIMPDISGQEAAEQINAFPGMRDTPIVFLTAAISREDIREAGGTLGGYPSIAKPAGLREIISTIEAHAGV